MFYEKKIQLDIFPTPIAFLVFDDPAILEKKTGVKLERDFYAMTMIAEKYTHVYKRKKIVSDDVIIACFKPDRIEDYTFGQLAHEAVHVANRVFDIIGYNPDKNEDEILAYLVQYITDQLVYLVEDVVKFINEERK